MKEKTIYQKGDTRVYINQCHNKGKKTKLFAIRKDDDTGYAALIGLIQFDGRWRQFVFCPEAANTKWSSGCMQEIAKFLIEETYRWKDGITKKRRLQTSNP